MNYRLLSKRLSLNALLFCVGLSQGVYAEPVKVGPLLKKVHAVQAKGAGHPEAISAIQKLSKADGEQIPSILEGIDAADLLQTNWLRAAVESVAQRELDAGRALPVHELETFLTDTKHAPRARRLAYELINQVDKTAERRLIPSLLNDPSLELRRDAVALVVANADSQVNSNKLNAVLSYRRGLSAARDLDQIESIAKKLRDLGEAVDLPSHFGFVMRWKLLAPFDNTQKEGFDVAYRPETDLSVTESYKGKEGKVDWVEHTTKDEYGTVDLNTVLAKHKGAIAYAYSEFVSDENQKVDLRLGCINANKVWLNGDLLTSNQVYHANTQIDQYVGKGLLRKGINTILLKICQNEQEESWAQRWQFQLRVCDQYGTAVLSKDRPKFSTESSKKQ